MFGAVQFPFPEQIEDSDVFFPKQTVSSQILPTYPELQEQLFGAMHRPLPEQTFGFIELNPLHK